MSPGDSDGQTDATLDEVFHALSHSYRRRVLLALADRDPRDGGFGTG